MFKKKKLTAASLGIRMLMGGYLLYLAYQLIPSFQEATRTKELVFIGFMAVLFFCVGAIVVFFSIKAFIKGEYHKGDASEETETETEIEMDVEDKREMEDNNFYMHNNIMEDNNGKEDGRENEDDGKIEEDK
ncbi:MAG: hypothetical protein ACERKZ_20105 [Lachnotalea sp.]